MWTTNLQRPSVGEMEDGNLMMSIKIESECDVAVADLAPDPLEYRLAEEGFRVKCVGIEALEKGKYIHCVKIRDVGVQEVIEQDEVKKPKS